MCFSVDGEVHFFGVGGEIVDIKLFQKFIHYGIEKGVGGVFKVVRVNFEIGLVFYLAIRGLFDKCG